MCFICAVACGRACAADPLAGEHRHPRIPVVAHPPAHGAQDDK